MTDCVVNFYEVNDFLGSTKWLRYGRLCTISENVRCSIQSCWNFGHIFTNSKLESHFVETSKHHAKVLDLRSYDLRKFSNFFLSFRFRALSALSGGGYLGNVMGSQPVLYAHHRDPNSTAFYLHDRVRVSVSTIVCVRLLKKIFFLLQRNQRKIVALYQNPHLHRCWFMMFQKFCSSVVI